METIRTTLRDSKTARWIALSVVSFTMLCGYYITDVMAPLKPMLEKELLWSSTEYGFFTSAYGWFNVLLLMLILGGIILDKMGVRFTGKMATIIMVIGTIIKYWAVSTDSLTGEIFGMKTQVVLAGLGFATFSVGVEVAGITVSKIIVKWFKGKEMALAMGLEMATARLGTALALAISAPVASLFKDVAAPILLGLVLLCVGLISFFIYSFGDKRLDAELAAEAGRTGITAEEESFRVRDLIMIVTNKGWWYIAILCVLFYSSVFPFLKYASDLMVNKFGVDPEIAGLFPAMLPFGTILLTPLFGNIYDRKGRGASIMMIGAVILILVHALFSVPFLKQTPVAIILIIVLGIGFSLVPSAMWPSVPKIIPEKQLGSAYALIFWVQNIGLMLVPLLIGWVLDKFCITGTHLIDGAEVPSYNYTIPMMIFTGFGILSFLFAFLLKAEDKKKGYGLELPNIKK